MGAAIRTGNFGTHTIRIGSTGYSSRNLVVESRPATTGIKFIRRTVQLRTASLANVDTIFVKIIVFPRKGCFGSFVLQLPALLLLSVAGSSLILYPFSYFFLPVHSWSVRSALIKAHSSFVSSLFSFLILILVENHRSPTSSNPVFNCKYHRSLSQQVHREILFLYHFQATTGRSNTKVVPFPYWLNTWMVEWCSSIIFCTIASPKPVLLLVFAAFVVTLEDIRQILLPDSLSRIRYTHLHFPRKLAVDFNVDGIAFLAKLHRVVNQVLQHPVDH